MAALGLSRVSSDDLVRVLRLLHRGVLASPITRSRLIELALGHVEGDLDALVGCDARTAQALISAVLAERKHLRADPPKLAYTGVPAPGTRSRDTLEHVRELLGGAVESLLVLGLPLGEDRGLARAIAAVLEGRSIRARLVFDGQGLADAAEAAQALVSRHFRVRDKLEVFVCQGARLTGRAMVADGRRVLLTSGELCGLEDDGRIDVGAVFDAPSYAQELHEELERLRMAGVLLPLEP